MNGIEFHAQAMQREFNAGRIASARWHCERFTELMKEKVSMVAQAAQPGLCDPARVSTPSPFKRLDKEAGNE
jgi:hypothetical protein